MALLKVERLDGGTYNRMTVLKDSKGAVKHIIHGYINQPKKNAKTIVINKKEYQLDWSNV